jgi:hypothetical protein
MTCGPTDIAAYLRGRLHLAGVDADTPVGTVLDVLLTIVVDVPADALKDWRKNFDRALRPLARQHPESRRVYPDRETWGLLPQQQAAMAKLAGTRPS